MSRYTPLYLQIHIGERRIIERLYEKGYTAGRIAKELFRSRSTITREIQRNGYPGKDGQWNYKADIAQRFYADRQENAYRRKLFKHPDKPQEEIVYYPYKKRLFPRFRAFGNSPWGDRSIYWFRKNPQSRWHEWKEWSWRTWYNRRRIRCYSWEEMGRRLLATRWPAAWTASRRFRWRCLMEVKPGKSNAFKSFDQLQTNWPKPAGRKPIKINWPISHTAQRATTTNAAPPAIQEARSIHRPTSRKPQGKTMPAREKINGISKNPAPFRRGSPRFLLRLA